MNLAAVRANRTKLLVLTALVLLCAAGYLLVEVNLHNPKLFAYAMKLRTPKLIVMLLSAFAIGGASIVFQSIINNTIVTPCLLGMNSLYTLIHTAVVFFQGSGSAIALNANLAFGAYRHGDLQLDFSKDPAQCALCAAGRDGPHLLFRQHPDHPHPGDGPQ